MIRHFLDAEAAERYAGSGLAASNAVRQISTYRDKILAAVNDGKCHFGDIADTTGIPRRQVSVLLHQLHRAGEIRREVKRREILYFPVRSGCRLSEVF